MPRTNDKTQTEKKSAKKSQPIIRKGGKAKGDKTINGDNGFCIGAEWSPRGDE